MFFNRVDAFRWRDPTEMNELVLRSSFPEVTMEFRDDWDDRVKMGVPFVFERVVLADRSSAMRAYNYQRYQRTAAVPFALPGSVNWWMTIRNNVVQFAGLDLNDGSSTTATPVITYISRQEWGRRTLIQRDHEKLVQELYRLRNEHGWEVNIVRMEEVSRAEQIRIAVRTTVSPCPSTDRFLVLIPDQIMMGVHGNGLTNLIWMRATPRTTVLEFFYPGTFTRFLDYFSKLTWIFQAASPTTTSTPRVHLVLLTMGSGETS
jgi:hypothetical protein